MSLDPTKFSTAIWPSSRVRDTFVNFFKDKYAHVNIKSSPVVPHNDPTLLFTNAGMNQFKEVFTGQLDPSSTLVGVKRVVNTQKCIRAGGKHNDLDDVGKDSYHHTFFEMLGTWSFGDYFKIEAIDWAWELLTEVYGLPKDRLYATFFKGDEKNNIPRDEEARQRWLKYLPENHVLPFGAKENFWEMGDTGPCGPCTEIHFDLKGGRDASSLVNRDDPTVIEIWNLVFMQFNRNPDQTLTPLPNKHVDTGAGFERFVGVLQNKMSNYDSDLFGDLFVAIQKATNDPKGYTNKYHDADVDSHDMAYRVIADHIRTLTFALTDGAVPDSDGRGYVLRRIVRRAVRYGTQVLKAPPGFFHQLVPAVVAKLSNVFPEITGSVDNVTRIIKREEDLFMRTLDNGTKRLGKFLDKLDAQGGPKILEGAEMWDMYSTYGFPPDLTELMCAERGVKVDKAGYEAASAASRIQRVSGTTNAEPMPALDVHATDHLNKLGVAPTDDSHKYRPEHRSIDAKIVAIYHNGAFVDKVANDRGKIGVVLDRTNFYSDAGGQVADAGEFRAHHTCLFDVVDVQMYAGYALHVGLLRGNASLSVGDKLHTLIDDSKRAHVTANHTTTHMLNWALRRTCGTSVEQKGSKVLPGQLRFDFAHDGPLGVAKVATVDNLVNEVIKSDFPVFAKEVPIATARAVSGLTAVFGEKYPDPVRMVSIGVNVDALVAAPTFDWGSKFSVEFCGGTHLSSTKLAGSYVTLSESGIAQGIRRIVGVTSNDAVAARENAVAFEKELVQVEQSGIETDDNKTKLNQLLVELEKAAMPLVKVVEFRERIDAIKAASLAKYKDRAADEKSAAEAFVAKTLAEHKASPLPFVVANLPELGGNQTVMLHASYDISNQGIPTLLISSEKPKAADAASKADAKKPKVIVVATVPASCKSIAAGAWCQAAVTPFGGKGGGKPDKGQGSHEQLDKAADSAAAAKTFASQAK